MSSENEYNFNTNQIGPRIPEGIKSLILESSSWVREHKSGCWCQKKIWNHIATNARMDYYFNFLFSLTTEEFLWIEEFLLIAIHLPLDCGIPLDSNPSDRFAMRNVL